MGQDRTFVAPAQEPRASLRESREVVEGILWILRTGARWRDLPELFPSPATCWRRLQRWEEDGTWKEVWRVFLSELDQRGRLDWEETFADATQILFAC